MAERLARFKEEKRRKREDLAKASKVPFRVGVYKLDSKILPRFDKSKMTPNRTMRHVSTFSNKDSAKQVKKPIISSLKRKIGKPMFKISIM